MTVNEIMNLVRLYRKEPKLAIAGERANQRLRSVMQEIADTPATPDNHELVAVIMLAQYTIRDGRNGPR